MKKHVSTYLYLSKLSVFAFLLILLGGFTAWKGYRNINELSHSIPLYQTDWRALIPGVYVTEKIDRIPGYRWDKQKPDSFLGEYAEIVNPGSEFRAYLVPIGSLDKIYVTLMVPKKYYDSFARLNDIPNPDNSFTLTGKVVELPDIIAKEEVPFSFMKNSFGIESLEEAEQLFSRKIAIKLLDPVKEKTRRTTGIKIMILGFIFMLYSFFFSTVKINRLKS